MRRDHLEIAKKYCRLHRNGYPMRCKSKADDEYQATPKLIYDNEENAKAARDEFEALPGAVYLRAYPCQRSSHGHYHLTTDNHAAKVLARRNKGA